MPRQPHHQPDQNDAMMLRDEATSFDQHAFDNLIAEQGVTFRHWRALACPLGMVDPDDDRHPHQDHPECSNGFMYVDAGLMTCGFTGNSKNSDLTDFGRKDGSTAQIVVPRIYDRTSETSPEIPVEICPFDRLYLDEGVGAEAITVPTWERLAASPTGRDRTEFPIVKVTDLIDAQGQRYRQGDDFTIEDGVIVWGTRRPGLQPTGKGTVFSIRYRYRPHWYIDRLMHEVRVGPVADELTGERRMLQFPQGAIIAREYFFKKDQFNSRNPRNPRTVNQPTDVGSGVPGDDNLGPR